VHGRATRRSLDQSCRRGNDLAAKDFAQNSDFLADVIEDVRLDAGTHSVGSADAPQRMGNLERSFAPLDALRRL
jgi:hypothetical protein